MVKNEILSSVLCKTWGCSGKPPLFFYFFLDQFHTKLTRKCPCFSEFFGIQKWNWLMVSWDETGINYETARFGQEKKMKLTERGFAAAISFNFFPDRNGRFHNFSQIHSWNHSQCHLFSRKNRKNTNILRQCHIKLTEKKRGFQQKLYEKYESSRFLCNYFTFFLGFIYFCPFFFR